MIEHHGASISTSKEVRFLGFTIEEKLKMNSHLERTCKKIRQAAGRIRSVNLNSSAKMPLYYAWVHSHLLSNGAAFLPFLSQRQTEKLQTSCNMAIRATANKSFRPMIIGPKREVKANSASKLRRRMAIPSVETVKNMIVAKQTWKMREELRRMEDRTT